LIVFQTYNELEIYQLSHNLAIEIHKLSLSLPKFENVIGRREPIEESG